MIVRLNVDKERMERPKPWGYSLLVHCGLLMWLLWPGDALKKSPSAYDQLIKGKENKIIIYQFKKKLPDVKPLTRADSRPPRAEVLIAKQSIISSPKNAPKERQMVWMPAPELKQPPKVDLANLMALKMTPVPAPERKKFVAQTHTNTVKEVSKPTLVEAPELTTAKALTVKAIDQLGPMPQPARLKFAVAAAKASVSTAKAEAMAAPPPAASAALSATGPNLSELNIAVVGINPPAKDAKLPEGSRAAQFSAGPVLNPNGGTGKGNPNASLTLPDLVVTGGGADAKATLLALSRPLAPGSAEFLKGMSKYAAPSAPASAAGAARVTSAPNSKFDGREVYSMAVQMPNITSYSGSWLMWYADRSIGREGPLAPPVAHRKVDPKYIVSAVVDRIEGRVQLLCVINRAGHVGQVELVRGIDARLDQSAMEALAKWEFTPASRKGEAVDVDVMVEIPFKLAPKEVK